MQEHIYERHLKALEEIYAQHRPKTRAFVNAIILYRRLYITRTEIARIASVSPTAFWFAQIYMCDTWWLDERN